MNEAKETALFYRIRPATSWLHSGPRASDLPGTTCHIQTQPRWYRVGDNPGAGSSHPVALDILVSFFRGSVDLLSDTQKQVSEEARSSGLFSPGASSLPFPDSVLNESPGGGGVEGVKRILCQVGPCVR